LLALEITDEVAKALGLFAETKSPKPALLWIHVTYTR